jgi:hypothetical protein
MQADQLALQQKAVTPDSIRRAAASAQAQSRGMRRLGDRAGLGNMHVGMGVLSAREPRDVHLQSIDFNP